VSVPYTLRDRVIYCDGEPLFNLPHNDQAFVDSLVMELNAAYLAGIAEARRRVESVKFGAHTWLDSGQQAVEMLRQAVIDGAQ